MNMNVRGSLTVNQRENMSEYWSVGLCIRVSMNLYASSISRIVKFGKPTFLAELNYESE